MLPVSTENYVGGVWENISKCVHVWMWKEAVKGKEGKTQMELIFNSVLVGLSFIYKLIYTSNLADKTISIHRARMCSCPYQHLAKADVSPQLFSPSHFCWHIPTQKFESLTCFQQLLSQPKYATPFLFF